MSTLPDFLPTPIALAAAFPAALLLLALCGCTQALPSAALTLATPQLRDSEGASSIVPGRYVVLSAAGISIRQTSAPVNTSEDAANLATFAGQPGVEMVLHDRFVEAHQISTGTANGAAPTRPIASDDPADAFYNSPQGWAVVQAGGFGSASVPGPWSITQGAGTRIAVLDTGVDATHPDIAPNLTLNLSEVDTTALPSVCDNGSPQDQHGHGTWTASLATGAAGPGTGGVIGVAPQASLLNIKVLERVSSTDSASASNACVNGPAAGLLSWVILGINDAVAHHANIISLSLGSIVDLNSGDGAGWKIAFDRATHAAANAGVIIVAAAGNDGLDLSGGRFIELPAQARDVLPVVASTNPACAEDLTSNATCHAGPATRAYYSNYGATLNAIAAPGGSLPNTSETGINGFIRGACSSAACFANGPAAYTQAMGTSASAPLTAGAAALVQATHPAWTPAQIIAALRSSGIHSASITEPQLDTAAAIAIR